MSFLLERRCEWGLDGRGKGGWSELVYIIRMTHDRTCGADVMDMAHRLAVAKSLWPQTT